MKEIVVLPLAHDEILDVLIRLDDLREELSNECKRALEESLLFLSRFPEASPVSKFPPLRRTIIQKFSLGVFYSITGKRVFIHAVLDLRQDPQWIRRRLQG